LLLGALILDCLLTSNGALMQSNIWNCWRLILALTLFSILVWDR